MPRVDFDRELERKGYVGFLPGKIREAIQKRKPGYFEWCVKHALKHTDGLWYYTRDQLEEAEIMFKLYTKTSEGEFESWEPQEQQRYLTVNFFNLKQPCKFRGCEDMRKKYQQEIGALGDDCPACTKNKIRLKYTKFIYTLMKNGSITFVS